MPALNTVYKAFPGKFLDSNVRLRRSQSKPAVNYKGAKTMFLGKDLGLKTKTVLRENSVRLITRNLVICTASLGDV